MRRRRLSVVVLLLAVVAAATVATAGPASAGGGCHRPATEGVGTTLALSELCFSPTVLRVEPGAEVRVVNRDTIAHPLSRPGGDWYWDGTVGEATTVRMDQAGTYPFYCFAHPGMVGVVVAGERQVAAFPAAWMVLVALAALVGAVAGTRLTARTPRA
jgi:plastocyanin